MESSSNFPAKSLFWNFNDCSATYLRCKEKTVGSSHGMFVCLLTTYTCCKNVMVFYHILCCFWVLLLPWTIDRNPPRTQNFFVLCFAQNFWQIITYLHLHPLLVESWWSEWIVMAALLLLLFMMKVNVWHFNSHQVIRPYHVVFALIVMLLSKCFVLEIFVQNSYVIGVCSMLILLPMWPQECFPLFCVFLWIAKSIFWWEEDTWTLHKSTWKLFHQGLG